MLQRVLVRKFGGLAHIRSRVFPGETSIGPSPASLFYHRLQLHTLLWRPFTLHPICNAILSADRPVNSARNCLEVGANNPAEVMSLRVSAVLKYPFSEIKEIGKAAAIHLRSRKRKKLTAALSGIASRLVKWHKLCRNSNLIWSTANATA